MAEHWIFLNRPAVVRDINYLVAIWSVSPPLPQKILKNGVY